MVSGMPLPFAAPAPGLERMPGSPMGPMPDFEEPMNSGMGPVGTSVPLPSRILERQFSELLRPPASLSDASERENFAQRLNHMMKLSKLFLHSDAVGTTDAVDDSSQQAPQRHALDPPTKQATFDSIAMVSTDVGESLYADEDSVEAEVEESEAGRGFSAVPRHVGQAGSTQAMTTLMIRNIPVMYSMAMLLIEWPNEGTYDFAYLPYSVALQRNQTYAFINFTSEAEAMKFRNLWQKRRLAHYTSRKALNVGFADIQGRDLNLMQFKAKPARRANHCNQYSECQPLVFENGVRVPMAHALAKLEGRKESMSSS